MQGMRGNNFNWEGLLPASLCALSSSRVSLASLLCSGSQGT